MNVAKQILFTLLILKTLMSVAFAKSMDEACYGSEMLQVGKYTENLNEERFKDLMHDAQSNVLAAKTAIAVSYIDGIFVEKDEDLARKWLTDAAKGGSQLARFFLIGDTTASLNDDQQMEALSLLGLEGFVYAQVYLGLIHFDLHNHEEAKKWYLSAAKQGCKAADNKLKELSTFD